MAYDVTLVSFHGGGLGGISGTVAGWTGSFNYRLLSMWACLPNTGATTSNITVGGTFGVITAQSDRIAVNLAHNNASLYNATFSGPVPGQRYNVLVSVDCPNQVVQVYVNDAPATLVSGGWITSGILGSTGLYIVDHGETGGIPAVADVWDDPPLSFVDLTTVSNRRKFIHANLAPVDLGSDGSNPFGSSPPVFLTVPSGGVPTDFQTNFGTGAPLSTATPGLVLGFQPLGTCSVPTVPMSRPMVSIIGRSAGTPPP